MDSLIPFFILISVTKKKGMYKPWDKQRMHQRCRDTDQRATIQKRAHSKKDVEGNDNKTKISDEKFSIISS
jgi:hypothetical protein